MKASGEVLSPGETVNPYSGEAEPSWSVPGATLAFTGCEVWPEYSNESPSPDRPHYVMTGLSLSLPYGSVVHSGDRVRLTDSPYAGMWQVEGRPAHWSHEDHSPGTVVKLVEVTG